MNMEQCIAALPRIEKGILRDNLVAEFSKFSDKPEVQVSSLANIPNGQAKQSSRPLQPTTQPQRQQTGNTADGRFNCSVCKKSFGSEATWNSHEMSAKHIAAIKGLEKKNKGGSKVQSAQKNNNNNGGSPGNSRSRVQENTTEDEDPPEVAEALMSFRKVEKIVKENPGMAASVLWKIAKALWSFRQSQETANVLSLLIRVLKDLQGTSSSGIGAGAGSGPPVPGTLTPTQISMTLYLSRLSMARLILYQSPLLASQYYLDAIQGRWQIDPNDLQVMCEMVSTTSVTQLLDHCKNFLSTHPKTEKLMFPTPSPSSSSTTNSESPVPKKAADPNLKLLTILLESASMLSQMSPKSSAARTVSKSDRVLAEIAVVLFALTMTLTGASEEDDHVRRSKETELLRNMATVYNRGLGMNFAAASCLIQAGDIGLTDLKPETTTEQDRERISWDLFQALLLAMETGDFVRMQHAIRLLSYCDTSSYHDVQTILGLASAVISQDNDFLHNNAAYALEHLLLLVQEPYGAGKTDMLLYRFSNPTASIAALHRVQQLVS
ncbi:hypothetical protein BGX28_005674 [Mortierella sp. GBA30]|nr:hypothetical protein BGX28_005674 [Mortierella sp. GBA30]